MTYPPFKHFTLMEQTPTTASDSAAMTPEPTQEQKEFNIVSTSAIAAFKERLRQKVEERINSLEIQQRNSQSTDGYLFYMNEINAQRGFLELLAETH